MVIDRESLKTKKAFPRKNVCFCRYIDKICVRDVFFFLTTCLRRHPDNTGTLPSPIIRVRIVQFQLILL